MFSATSAVKLLIVPGEKLLTAKVAEKVHKGHEEISLRI
jgi:hypothetical protein